MRLLYKQVSPTRQIMGGDVHVVQHAILENNPALLREVLNWRDIEIDFSWKDS